MDFVRLGALVVNEFTACGEFASFAFVHPVVRRLPAEQHLTVEQGLLRTFGRVMPVLMPLTPVLTLAHALGSQGNSRRLAMGAVGAAVAAVAVTVVGNVPINSATARWDPAAPPTDWKSTRDRWERLQAVRSPMLLASFVLLAASASDT